MPYKNFPKLMVVLSLETNITWLNVFPKINLIYKTPSTSTIVVGTPKIDATQTTLQHGSYVYCKFDTLSMNNMKTSSVVEIALRRLKNVVVTTLFL